MESEKEKIILEASAMTKYNPEMIELLYDFTGGDKNGILKILSSINKNILVLKCNFDAKPIEKAGFFYFAYDVAKNEMLEKGLYAYRQFQKLNLEESWENLRKIIYEFKSESKFDKSMSAIFEREISSDNFLRELKRVISDFMNNPRYRTVLDTLLIKGLAPAFYNKNFALDTEIEMLDPFLFYKPLEKKEPVESEEDQNLAEPKSDDNMVTLKVYPVLDALEGKTVREISSGDSVLFELKDDREAAYYIAELLQKENPVGLVGRITSYSIIDEESVRLNVSFVPGINGECIVNTSVRLKVIGNLEISGGQSLSLKNLKKIEISYKTFIKIVIAIIFIIGILLLINS